MSNQRRADSLVTGVVLFRHSTGMPCPYLPGRVERQVYTDLAEPTGREVFRRLSAAGFRRSHHITYRPACPGCSACVPVRVPVAAFEWSRSWRRNWNANKSLTAEDVALTIDDEQYRLFRRYVRSRHGDGDMAMMHRRDYAAMVLTSCVDTAIIEFREDGVLRAACLIDILPDGLSAVYSFFDPDLHRRSPGSYMVLWLIEEARRRGLAYVYLGFWIADSPKMAYKTRFRPLEGFGKDGWSTLHP